MFAPEFRSSNFVHTAGIIPLTTRPPVESGFRFPFEFPLLPIGRDLIVAEKCVFECASVGCTSIWIVVDDDAQLALRRRLGDWVFRQDGFRVQEKRGQIMIPERSPKSIPIFYVPLSAKDRKRRDSLAWRVFAGAKYAHEACRRYSRFFVPNNYYATFPTGVHKWWMLDNHRADLQNPNGFYVRYQGKTIVDGLPLGFSFAADRWVQWKERLRHKGSEKSKLLWFMGENHPEVLSLPESERWDGRLWSLDRVFDHEIHEDASFHDLDQFFHITTLHEWSEAVKACYGYRQKGIAPYRLRKAKPVAVLDDEIEESGGYIWTMSGWKNDHRNEDEREDDEEN